MIRRLRANLLDELQKQYVVTGRAKGLPPFRLLVKYPLRMSLNPFIADIGNLLPQVVSGAAIVSVVLSLPTTGPMLVRALQSQDMYLAARFSCSSRSSPWSGCSFQTSRSRRSTRGSGWVEGHGDEASPGARASRPHRAEGPKRTTLRRPEPPADDALRTEAHPGARASRPLEEHRWACGPLAGGTPALREAVLRSREAALPKVLPASRAFERVNHDV